MISVKSCLISSLVLSTLVLSTTPSEANYFEQVRERVENGAAAWDPTVRGSNSDRLLKNADQGTIPYRHSTAERALDGVEDYYRLQYGLPPRNLSPEKDAWNNYGQTESSGNRNSSNRNSSNRNSSNSNWRDY